MWFISILWENWILCLDWNNSHNKLTQDENDENKYTGEEKQLLYMLLYEAIAHTGVGFFKKN